MLTLRMLKTFRLVAQTGSFAAAAERAALTQAAVSLQMRGLEDAVGQRLFDRRGRQITLTRQGRELFPRVEQILALAADLTATPIDAMQGPVTIGAVVSVIGALSLVVAELKTAHPQLDVRLTSARSDELTDLVEQGEVDIAAVVARADDARAEGLVWTPLYTEPMAMVVNRDVAQTDPQHILDTHAFLRFDRRVRTGMVVEQALRSAKLTVMEYLELNSIETIVALVRKNVGVSVLPLLHRGDWQSDPLLRIVPIADPPLLRTVGMIHRAHDARTHNITTAIVRMLHDV
ncbi:MULTISPECIES: LysR substrate-binding domain-containing protein [Pandoraea]|jgi:DNA-binding transcriptional LysR family regulator|uniref:LysR substrate-binding domain-containing protein n=1 Tax=Pandoraea TaxID=93217 RepID=UPI0003C73B75|nr:MULTISPECIES: LysR substrate-binding domain-containing protein [Pandoraea]AHB07154.1 LysR family transcriptional regulator [Pandoraea pnomenusa 3kgm]AHB76670.1 LysR family transcriptional regulator [Pandoraea pnomenusa]AHN74973.1 LysR family transcriptional regulator [Pandoraea pnomenusa]ANC45548.1 LysR family transcriptional regulator [Pandoraea pnomenusa]MBN9092152.1 LysR family transcriptional regulator [Pandoraea pnomenusa]